MIEKGGREAVFLLSGLKLFLELELVEYLDYHLETERCLAPFGRCFSSLGILNNLHTWLTVMP